MSSSFLLRSFRILLFPFALIYGLGVRLRNWLYDKNIRKTAVFNLPVICVGNLSVGGTGKSPMVEYLVRHLQPLQPATLSRGYRRKTTGYLLAGPGTTAIEIGDEPLMFYRKFPWLAVAVGEERIIAIPQLLHDRPETGVIVLDDAFQHRDITAGLNILLTDYSNLYSRDFFLPTGDLRDAVSSAKRAQVIVVTKCPPGLTAADSKAVEKQLGCLPEQQVFFSCIEYGTPYHILSKEPGTLTSDTEALLVTGIASPAPLQKYLDERVQAYDKLAFRDHHVFTIDDLRDIKKAFNQLSGPDRMLVTTEKDAMRLEKFGAELEGLPFYVLPIEMRILFGAAPRFLQAVDDFIKTFKS